MDGLSTWANQNSGLLAVTGILLTAAIAVVQIMLNRKRGGRFMDTNKKSTALRKVAVGWLSVWLVLLVATVGIGFLSVMQFGLPGLAVAALMLAFIGSLPAWITVAVPSIAEAHSPKKPTPDDDHPLAYSGAPSGSEMSNPHGREPMPETPSDPNESDTAKFESPLSESGVVPSSTREKRRQPGSREYKELIFALRSALPDQARITRVVDFAGLNRGDVEDGYVDATTRWHAVMRLALDSDMEEDVCLAALDASPRRDLRDAITAYLA